MISTSRSTTDAAATPNDAVYKKVSQERKREREKNKTGSYMNNMEKGEQAIDDKTFMKRM